jgi:hypothetical protein
MEEQDQTKKIGKLSPLSLTKALQKTVPHVKKTAKCKYLQKLFEEEQIQCHPETTSVVDFVLYHPQAAKQLQQKYKFRWVIVRQHRWKNNKKVCIVYDATHAITKNDEGPVHYLLLSKKNVLKRHTKEDATNLPHLTNHKPPNLLLKNQQPLWQLLGYNSNPSSEKKDPQNKPALKTFLESFTQPKTFVQIYFVHSTETKKKDVTLWVESHLDLTKPLLKVIKIYAWKSENYQVVYSKDSDRSYSKAKKRGQDMEAQFAKYEERIKQLEEHQQEQTNPLQANNASSISLSYSGLNLAYNLGLIKTQKELAQFSNELANTMASLYIFVDEKNHLRHITYYDKNKTFFVEVGCNNEEQESSDKIKQRKHQNKTAETMLKFWQRVWQQRQHWINERQRILKVLIEQLDITDVSKTKKDESPFSRCKADLKKIVNLQHLFVFSNQESHLHAIKFYLADFGYNTLKRFKGVTIKAQSDGTLTTLNIPGLTIFNLHSYFGTKNDADFFSSLFHPDSYNPSLTIIPHQHKDLYRQSYQANKKLSLGMHCKQTGKKCSQFIVEYWKKFCQIIMSHFGFEVHGQINVPSASFLSFQCIWTAYAQKAGPMAQALEKCKPHHEDLLRDNSKGGFMFSVEDALDEGSPLWPNLDQNILAQTIAEIDLVSSYGYAAAHTYMPSGFCTGFGKINPSNSCLERLDKKSRHKTFEFRAVYKTLHDLKYKQNVAIRSVYSNFSPLGIFYVGPYPIDLVVISEEGQVLLYQMDGQWIHGCPKCNPLERYVENRTHEQVRQKTLKRDGHIQAWAHSINVKNYHKSSSQNFQFRVKYKVIQDCHSDEYIPASLEYQFYNTPNLAKTIQGYHVMDSLGNTMTIKKLEHLLSDFPGPDYTFIAKCSLQVHQHPDELFHAQGPLIVYQTRPDKHTKQSLAYAGTVILTRDYYEWLKESFHSVVLQDLEWILLYKTEPLFNEIYDALIQLRSSTQDSVAACFIKRMINLSCGFYGTHTAQTNKTTYRLVDGPPKNLQFFRHHFNVEHVANVGQSGFILLETQAWPKVSPHRKVSSSAVPMFLCIIEFGKLRLMQILNFLQRNIHPSQFRTLYSNIDNIVFALGNANTLVEAVHPLRINHFHAEKNQFLGENGEKAPGKAELEWIRNDSCGWRFVSLRTQHYCLIVTQPHADKSSLHKTSGWTHLSSQEAYALAMEMLAGRQVKLIQTRRVNKKCNMDTHQVEFVYGAESV